MKSKMVFADANIKKAFEKLSNSKSENKKLYKWLNRAFDDISNDAFCATQVPKKLIPRIYLNKYEIDNLWKYDLPNGWRLMYSVARDEIIIISIILEWLPHQEYERRFGY